MKAVAIEHNTDERRLSVVDLPEPQVGKDEVLIAVAASGVNRADILQRAGKYPAPPGVSETLGLEVAGIVEQVGRSVSTLRRGDTVCALLAGGGYAEKVVVPASQIISLPGRYSMNEGAAIPEAFITAYVNLFVEAALTAGERVLIHGGSSGVGTAAIQLAKQAGAFVAVTVGSDEKATACMKLGAEAVINYRTTDFAAFVARWSPSGVDVVLDMVGREYFTRNVSVLANKGRLVCIAAMSGAEVSLNVAVLMKKRAKIIGSVLRSRSIEEKGTLITGFLDRFGQDLADGLIAPVVDSVFPLEQVEQAHARMVASQHIGKIVLSLR